MLRRSGNADYPDTLVFACPGCGLWGQILARHPKTARGVWDVTGGALDNPESLTLAPSINCVGCCGWHGYLQAGVFNSV